MKRGKKYRKSAEKIEKDKLYSMEEAIKLVRENKIAKFDESVEVHVHTNIDPKKGEQMVRGTVVLPHGTGKTKKVAVVTTTHMAEAKAAGAEIIGGDELIEDIKNGKAESFDVLVATPEMMPKLARVAKILGPKGLMPNPKTETVTVKIKETVEALKKGKAAFKNDDSGNVHQVVGRVSFSEDQLMENAKAFLEAVNKAKTSAVKGRFIESVTLCSTMGKGVHLAI